ncbi:MAG: cytochrome c oxidase assembly protein [Xanthomonadales bacterium]|nr:cytochrome c oxidase assembly protein [Xanthomonadales bacterium]
MSEESKQHQRKSVNRRLVGRLVIMAVAMFGFGYAMVPLYGVFCDITGLGGRSVNIAANADGVQVSEREVRIRFLATTHSDLPWMFQPLEKTSTIKLGELSETRYLAMNPTQSDMIGQATYNVVPPEASLYFVKTECFCFTEQMLASNESREMPVYFFVQPDLPESIKEITLSYTFYRNEKAERSALALASAHAPVNEN